MKKKLFLVIVLTLVMALALSATSMALEGYISSVYVKGLNMPTAGQTLDFNAYTPTSLYSVTGITWYDKTTNSSPLDSSYKAEAGHKYQYHIEILAEDGYGFHYDANSNGTGSLQFYSDDAWVNDYYCTRTKDPGPYAVVWTPNCRYLDIYGYYTVPAAPSISNVAITVTAPQVGAKPATSFKAVNKTNDVYLDPYDLFWLEYDENTKRWEDMSTSTFQAGKEYEVELVIKPETGYFAGAENSTSTWNTYTGTYTVNGAKPTSYNSSVNATGADTTNFARALVVYYVFPKLETLPVITKQPTAQTVAPGSNATFTVEASGENLKYQWYGGTDASPTPLSGNSNQLTLTNLTLNHSGTDFWCVVSNDAGSVTSSKARLTVADNYVMPFTDVKESDWFYNHVKKANQTKLIAGKTPTLFKPYDNMTYAEAIKLAACMNQYYYTGAVTLTKGTPWYQPFVDYAKTHGIPWNYPDYNANITRADYAYIFYYALPASDYKQLNSFGLANIPDVGPSTFGSSEILALYNAGILRGSDSNGVKGYFKPDDDITRAEVSAILTRMMDKETRLTFTL